MENVKSYSFYLLLLHKSKCATKLLLCFGIMRFITLLVTRRQMTFKITLTRKLVKR